MNAVPASQPATTDGSLLAGRIAYRQPVAGYRTGIEPVLLAAAVPARPGQRVLEAGCGAGAGLLCLATRVDCVITGVEQDPALAALATANATRNGLQNRVRIEASPLAAVAAAHAGPPFHHVMANPPWHNPAGTPSPIPGRQAAKFLAEDGLHGWIGAMVRLAAPRGQLHLILAAANLEAACAALASHGAGSLQLRPLWPRAGRPCRMLLLRATRGGRSPTQLLPGLTLHGPHGYTPAADVILRDGQPWSDQ